MQEAGPNQPASTDALRLEHTTLQSDLTRFDGLLEDLNRAQSEQPAEHNITSQERTFSLMCELNDLRDLPHHSRRAARNECVQVTMCSMPS